MPLEPDQIQAVESVVAAYAREIHHGRVDIPGRKVLPEECPDPVQEANEIYGERLTPPDDSYGFVHTYQLGIETGSALLVVAHHDEASWGVVEIYTRQGELQQAAVYIATGVAWLAVEVVREAMLGYEVPIALMPKPAALEWVSIGQNACWSVGGRFQLTPDPAPPHQRIMILDLLKHTEHWAESLGEAQALASTLLDVVPPARND